MGMSERQPVRAEGIRYFLRLCRACGFDCDDRDTANRPAVWPPIRLFTDGLAVRFLHRHDANLTVFQFITFLDFGVVSGPRSSPLRPHANVKKERSL